MYPQRPNYNQPCNNQYNYSHVKRQQRPNVITSAPSQHPQNIHQPITQQIYNQQNYNQQHYNQRNYNQQSYNQQNPIPLKQTHSDALKALMEFSKYIISLNGIDRVLPLADIRKKEETELKSAPRRATCWISLSFISCVVCIVGLCLIIFGVTIVGVHFVFWSVPLLCFCTGCAFYQHGLTKKGATNRLYFEKYRDAILFDVNDQMIKQIEFAIDYGLGQDMMGYRAISKEEREGRLHEGHIMIKPGAQTICHFSHLVEIGWISTSGTGSSRSRQYLVLNFLNVTNQMVTCKLDLGHAYSKHRYSRLVQVMNNIDGQWIHKVKAMGQMGDQHLYRLRT